MRLFSTIFIAGAHANDFWVSNCQNTATNAIEMSIGLTEAYMDEHHDALKPSFTHDTTLGEYTNIIPGNALRQNFTDPDYIYMEYDMVRPDETVDNLIDFPGRTTTFKCRYPRTVTLSDNVSIAEPTDPPFAVGNGHFAFDFEVTASGGRTIVTITPQHGMSNLANNVDFCEISCNNCIDKTLTPLRAVHSWNQYLGLCVDNRFGTTLTTSTDSTTGVSSTVIDWRTFHFRDTQMNQMNPQTHNVRCDIHVERSSTMDNVPNCDCYSNDECNPPVWSPPSGLPATGWQESVQSFGTVHYQGFGWMTYGDAWNYCQLPTPTSDAENTFYASLTVGTMCLGFSDQETEGVWKNQAGVETTYFNWRSGQPVISVGNDQHWVALHHVRNNPEWDDFPSSGLCVVICTYIS